MTPVELTFWATLGLLGYIYVGYPVIIWGLSRFFPRPIRSAPITPTITVVIAAHNEETHIAAKIENCLALDYPPNRLDLIVVTDGSTDRTPAIVTAYLSRFPGRLTSISLPHRGGKAAALNRGVAHASGEIVMLADARQQFDSEVARALVRNFSDPQVGAVSGDLVLRAHAHHGGGTGLGLYWRYEKGIRRAESRWRSSMGYTGAVSAIRRSLFAPLPENTLLDDLVTPLRVISRRYRVVFEPGARAYDTLSPIPGREFARKVRTLAGVLQTCFNARALVGPLTAGVWWQLASHKLLRLIVPYLLVLTFVANAFLSSPMYRVTFLTQALLYGLGTAGLMISGRIGRSRFLSIPATFLWLNAAVVVATLRHFTGRRLDLWHIAAPDPRRQASPRQSAYAQISGAPPQEDHR